MIIKRGDKVRVKKDHRISKRDWKTSYGDIPMFSIFEVADVNRNCINLRLPDNWDDLGAMNYENSAANYDKLGFPWGFGFYSSEFEKVEDNILPEELFKI